MIQIFHDIITGDNPHGKGGGLGAEMGDLPQVCSLVNLSALRACVLLVGQLEFPHAFSETRPQALLMGMVHLLAV